MCAPCSRGWPRGRKWGRTMPDGTKRPGGGRVDDNRFYRMLKDRPAPEPAPDVRSMREEALAINRARQLAKAVEAASDGAEARTIPRESPREPTGAGIRPARLEDLHAFAAALLRRPAGAPELLSSARVRERFLIEFELIALGYPAGFLTVTDEQGQPAGGVGIARTGAHRDEALLVGPAASGAEDAAAARTEILLARALEAAASLGAGRLITHLPATDAPNAALFARSGFAPETTLTRIEAHRGAKVRLFMNPRDRIFVLEPGDDPDALPRAYAAVFPERPLPPETLREALRRPDTRFFLLLRDGEPAGLLELDLARPGRAVVPLVGARPGLNAEGVMRELLAAACRVAFRVEGIDRLEAHPDEHAVASGDLAPIGFRALDRCVRLARPAPPPPRP